jgi:hypothetical protein
MIDPERVDLSPLDPARDPEHWARIVEATRLRVEQVLSARADRIGVLAVLGSWARPILAAAAVALLALGAALASARSPAPHVARTSDVARLAALSAGMADGHRPTGAELAAAVRVRGAR